jgi:MFS family permease
MTSEEQSLVPTETSLLPPEQGAEATDQARQVGLGYQSTFLLASTVGGLSSVCVKQLLLPIQVSQLAPHTVNTSFALVASLGALAGLIAAPLTGALSDRTTARWGKRRPWIVFGILIGIIGLLTMALAKSIPILTCGEILAQVGVDTILATVTALIPDQILPERQAGISALNGMAPVVGGVFGLVLVTLLTDTQVVMQGYLVLIGISALCVGLFLLVLREHPAPQTARTPFHWRTFLVSFVRPLAVRDFVYTLLSRLLVFLEFTILGAYLLFYLRKVLHLSVPVAAHHMTLFQLLSTALLVVMALLAGWLSARVQRLKPFVWADASLMAVALLIIAFAPQWFALLLAAVLFGSGFGLYLGVDIALAVRILPRQTEAGKDLGPDLYGHFLASDCESHHRGGGLECAA